MGFLELITIWSCFGSDKPGFCDFSFSLAEDRFVNSSQLFPLASYLESLSTFDAILELDRVVEHTFLLKVFLSCVLLDNRTNLLSLIPSIFW